MVIFPVVSRRGKIPTRDFGCIQKYLYQAKKKVSCGKFPRRDPTGKLTFFFPAASCRNSEGPELTVRCCNLHRVFLTSHLAVANSTVHKENSKKLHYKVDAL